MFQGYLEMGGNEVVNRERVRGYARSTNCPVSWIEGAPCSSLADAIGDQSYDYALISDAPWYDPALPQTARFLGVYPTKIQGIPDSSRAIQITEGIRDGGTVQSPRRAVKSIRVTATLIGRGLDALESGMEWLNAAIDPSACGTHDTACGETDLCYWTDCPPVRGTYQAYSEFQVARRNLALNPRGSSTSTTFWGTPLNGTASLVADMPGAIATAYRWTRSATPEGAMRVAIGADMPGAGSLVHVMARVRASTAVTVNVYARSNITSNTDQSLLGTIVLAAGVTEIDVSGTSFAGAATASSGVVFLLAGGAVSQTIDFTAVLVESGGLGGLYFDGSTTDEVDGQGNVVRAYDWLGTADAAASVLQSRGLVDVQWGDAEYEEALRPYRRRMHGVMASSGPFITQEFSKDGFHAYVVEFTLTAGKPYVYSMPRTLNIEPLAPSLIQDYPRNLTPYPSAEIAAGLDPETDWINGVAANGGSQLTVPTHLTPSGGQTASPSVLDFGGAPFGGYRYWMAHTPFPAGSDAASDPNIVASNDGSTWVVPAGLTNPLDDQPGGAGAVNSDVELVPNATGGLLLMWRTYNPASAGGEEQLWIRTSLNGTSWTAKVMVRQDDTAVRRLTSPTLIRENDGWTMWAVDTLPSPNRIVRMRSEGAVMSTGGWTALTNTTLSLPAAREPANIQVRRIDNKYVGLVNDITQDSAGLAGDVYVMTSNDGFTWARGAAVAIPRAGGTGVGHQQLESASLVKKSQAELDVWVAGWNTGPPTVWNIFRATVTAPIIADLGVIVARNVAPNPSVEVDATSWVAAGTLVSGTAPAAYLTNGQSNDIAADGTQSFRARILGNGVTAVTGVADLDVYSEGPLAAGSNRRVSLSMWSALLNLGAGTLTSLAVSYEFFNGVTSLGAAVAIGSFAVGDFGGKAVSIAGLAVPASATKVRVRARARVSWASSATPASNSDIRLYADALLISIP